ncbi:MAG: hypothetical protein ACRC0V_00760 [Fusobacteriaceae bacterium]
MAGEYSFTKPIKIKRKQGKYYLKKIKKKLKPFPKGIEKYKKIKSKFSKNKYNLPLLKALAYDRYLEKNYDEKVKKRLKSSKFRKGKRGQVSKSRNIRQAPVVPPQPPQAPPPQAPVSAPSSSAPSNVVNLRGEQSPPFQYKQPSQSLKKDDDQVKKFKKMMKSMIKGTKIEKMDVEVNDELYNNLNTKIDELEKKYGKNNTAFNKALGELKDSIEPIHASLNEDFETFKTNFNTKTEKDLQGLATTLQKELEQLIQTKINSFDLPEFIRKGDQLFQNTAEGNKKINDFQDELTKINQLVAAHDVFSKTNRLDYNNLVKQLNDYKSDMDTQMMALKGGKNLNDEEREFLSSIDKRLRGLTEFTDESIKKITKNSIQDYDFLKDELEKNYKFSRELGKDVLDEFTRLGSENLNIKNTIEELGNSLNLRDASISNYMKENFGNMSTHFSGNLRAIKEFFKKNPEISNLKNITKTFGDEMIKLRNELERISRNEENLNEKIRKLPKGPGAIPKIKEMAVVFGKKRKIDKKDDDDEKKPPDDKTRQYVPTETDVNIRPGMDYNTRFDQDPPGAAASVKPPEIDQNFFLPSKQFPKFDPPPPPPGAAAQSIRTDKLSKMIKKYKDMRKDEENYTLEDVDRDYQNLISSISDISQNFPSEFTYKIAKNTGKHIKEFSKKPQSETKPQNISVWDEIQIPDAVLNIKKRTETPRDFERKTIFHDNIRMDDTPASPTQEFYEAEDDFRLGEATGGDTAESKINQIPIQPDDDERVAYGKRVRPRRTNPYHDKISYIKNKFDEYFPYESKKHEIENYLYNNDDYEPCSNNKFIHSLFVDSNYPPSLKRDEYKLNHYLGKNFFLVNNKIKGMLPEIIKYVNSIPDVKNKKNTITTKMIIKKVEPKKSYLKHIFDNSDNIPGLYIDKDKRFKFRTKDKEISLDKFSKDIFNKGAIQHPLLYIILDLLKNKVQNQDVVKYIPKGKSLVSYKVQYPSNVRPSRINNPQVISRKGEEEIKPKRTYKSRRLNNPPQTPEAEQPRPRPPRREEIVEGLNFQPLLSDDEEDV